MPRVFARAGFDVALLAPKDSLALKSRYVSRIAFLSASATSMEWLLALVHAIDRVTPDLLVPCDEMAVRLLFTLALEAPAGIDATLHARLLKLIAESLGDSRFYADSIDKTKLPAAAEALGIPVPPYAVVANAQDALAQAEALCFPVVLKRRFGFAGQGVAVVSTRDELIDAAQRLLRPDQLDLGGNRASRLLVQKFITGPCLSQALVARPGVPLASFGWERFAATNKLKGQTVVLRFVSSPQTRDHSLALCRGFGIGGFFNVQFVVDERTGVPYLLEINRRVVTHMHLGERVGRDLPGALLRALDGQPVDAAPLPDEEAGGKVVVFPREWLRDPGSSHLAELPVDAPWDEPELFAAMLAMRHEE